MSENKLSLKIIRPWLARRGLIVVPVPPDLDNLRHAGRSARVVTRQWIAAVIAIVDGTLEPHDTDEE